MNDRRRVRIRQQNKALKLMYRNHCFVIVIIRGFITDKDLYKPLYFIGEDTCPSHLEIIHKDDLNDYKNKYGDKLEEMMI